MSTRHRVRAAPAAHGANPAFWDADGTPSGTVHAVEDSELREAIITYLYANRTTGDGGTPLTLSDANLAIALGAEVDQFNNVLASLIEDGVVHGVPRRVVSTELQMELDCIRLRDDPLPPPDPQDLD